MILLYKKIMKLAEVAAVIFLVFIMYYMLIETFIMKIILPVWIIM